MWSAAVVIGALRVKAYQVLILFFHVCPCAYSLYVSVCVFACAHGDDQKLQLLTFDSVSE